MIFNQSIFNTKSLFKFKLHWKFGITIGNIHKLKSLSLNYKQKIKKNNNLNIIKLIPKIYQTQQNFFLSIIK